MRCHLIMRQHVHGYTSLSFKLPQATVNPEDLSFPSRTGRDGCPEGKKKLHKVSLVEAVGDSWICYINKQDSQMLCKQLRSGIQPGLKS